MYKPVAVSEEAAILRIRASSKRFPTINRSVCSPPLLKPPGTNIQGSSRKLRGKGPFLIVDVGSSCQ